MARLSTTPIRLAPARSSASSAWRTRALAAGLDVEHEDRGVALGGDGQGVGEEVGGRRVDDHEAHGPQGVEHVAERPGAEDAGRVLHRRAARQHPQVAVVLHLGERTGEVAALEDRGETRARGYAETVVDRGLAEVGVDQHDLLVEGRGRLGEVHGGERLARLGVGADDRDRARLAGALEDHEVGPQHAEGLDDLDALAAGDLGEDRQARDLGDLGAVLAAGEAVAREVRQHRQLAHDDERHDEGEDGVPERLGRDRLLAGDRAADGVRVVDRGLERLADRLVELGDLHLVRQVVGVGRGEALLVLEELRALEPQRVHELGDLGVTRHLDRLDHLLTRGVGELARLRAVGPGGADRHEAEIALGRGADPVGGLREGEVEAAAADGRRQERSRCRRTASTSGRGRSPRPASTGR